MAEIRREETFSSSGLSTAALAHADEPVQQEINADERSDQRVDGYDRSETTTTRTNANSGQAAETDEAQHCSRPTKPAPFADSGIPSRWALSMNPVRPSKKQTHS
jgi:hypothetical protein